MGNFKALLFPQGGQVFDVDGAAFLPQQGGGHGGGIAHAAGAGIADSGDKAADFQTNVGSGGVIIHTDDARIAGGRILDNGNANAHQAAIGKTDSFTVGLGGIIAGVPVADAQHIAGCNGIVQRIIVDIKVLIGAHIAVHFGQLVIHALLVFNTGNRIVEHVHGYGHGHGKGHGHCNQRDGCGHTKTDFFAHSENVLPCVKVVRCCRIKAVP